MPLQVQSMILLEIPFVYDCVFASISKQTSEQTEQIMPKRSLTPALSFMEDSVLLFGGQAADCLFSSAARCHLFS